jgi:hypothetical protein
MKPPKFYFIEQAFVTAVVILFAGCSMQSSERPANTISIEVRDDSAPDSPATLFDALNGTPDFNILANPTVVSDFNCFAANITGEGITTIGQMDNCTTPNNFNSRGMGVFSKPTGRGTPIQIEVPAGTNRSIDVYGIYPNTTECGGSTTSSSTKSGYLLGSKLVDITENTNVIVPVSFTSGTTASITCTDTSTGGGGGGSSAQYLLLNGAGALACANFSSPPSIPAPTGVIIGTAFTGGETSEATTLNSTMVVKECTSGGATQTQLVEYIFDASAYNLANYANVLVSWTGRSGNYPGACTGTPLQTFNAGGGEIHFYRFNNGAGSNLAARGHQYGEVLDSKRSAQAYSTPANYAYTGQLFVVRIIGPSTSAGACSTVSTDQIKLALIP